MGLEVVSNEIIAQGREEAKHIEAEGLKEAKDILGEAREQAAKILADREAAAKRDAERIHTQEIARAEFEARREVLTAKAELLARLKREALEALSGLDEGTRKKYLGTLVARAKSDVSSGIAHVRKQDVAIVEALGGYKVAGDLKGAGGLVVDSDDSGVSLDYRFESILEEAWGEILRQENKNLFG